MIKRLLIIFIISSSSICGKEGLLLNLGDNTPLLFSVIDKLISFGIENSQKVTRQTNPVEGGPVTLGNGGRFGKFSAHEAVLLSLINEFRGKSLGKVAWDAGIQGQTDLHNKYQISRGRISHDNFETRMGKAGLARSLPVENVAFFFDSRVESPEEVAKKIFEQWKNSPGHNRNMKAEAARFGAVSIGSDRDGGVYATMIFAGDSVKIL